MRKCSTEEKRSGIANAVGPSDIPGDTQFAAAIRFPLFRSAFAGGSNCEYDEKINAGG